MTVQGVKSAWRRAREKAGLPHYNFHDLRHACATLLVNTGHDLQVVRDILGHTSIRMTERYAHLDVQRTKRAMESLGRLVGNHTKIHTSKTEASRKAA